jgi:hypothetical protein
LGKRKTLNLLTKQQPRRLKKKMIYTVRERFQLYQFRSIGPAVTSGRISDFAVNPNNHSEYYVASSSGGVWKTTNRGVTYEPIFDGEGSYSIGCVTIDPNQ